MQAALGEDADDVALVLGRPAGVGARRGRLRGQLGGLPEGLVGGLGAGATVKLAVNALVHGLNAALSESLVLAERAGVDRTAAYEVFASGAAAAPFVLYKRAAFERPDETPVAFRLDLVGKDLDEYSLETVKMFRDDAVKTGFSI